MSDDKQTIDRDYSDVRAASEHPPLWADDSGAVLPFAEMIKLRQWAWEQRSATVSAPEILQWVLTGEWPTP